MPALPVSTTIQISNAFDLISGSKFGEDIYPNI